MDVAGAPRRHAATLQLPLASSEREGGGDGGGWKEGH